MLVLTIETSTSSAKALLYDSEHGVVAEKSIPFPACMASGGMQDTEAVFDITVEAAKSVAAGKDVCALAVVGVWHSIVICDENMKPVAPTYTWEFTRASEICQSVRADRELTHYLYTQTGCVPNCTYQPYTLRYLAQNGVDLGGKLLSSQAGYNFYRLTGERLETASIISGMGFLNAHELVYDKGALEFAGVRESQFSPLGTYRDTRPLTKEAANAMGIPAGIPVVSPHPDGAMNQIGNGASRPKVMTFSVGTSAAIRLSSAQPILSDPPGTWCYVGAEGWLCGAATAGACNCVNWFRKTVLGNRWSFEELESTFLDDCNTPVFLPFLFGERCPGWQDSRRGGFCRLDEVATAPQMFRALCEGVLFNIYQCYRTLTEYCGVPERLIMSGGILNSPRWTQMAADIFDFNITLSSTAQASMVGGAVLALHAAGGLADINDFVDGSSRVLSPMGDMRERYRQKYNDYLKYYHSGE